MVAVAELFLGKWLLWLIPLGGCGYGWNFNRPRVVAMAEILKTCRLLQITWIKNAFFHSLDIRNVRGDDSHNGMVTVSDDRWQSPEDGNLKRHMHVHILWFLERVRCISSWAQKLDRNLPYYNSMYTIRKICVTRVNPKFKTVREQIHASVGHTMQWRRKLLFTSKIHVSFYELCKPS